MRSDREEIPAPFTKADADKAETLEAKTRAQGSQRAALTAGCQVYWPSPYEVCGVIRDKYNALGGPGSFLSFPSSAELTNPGNTGKRSQFLNGPIYWSAATGAHPVVNSFLNRWGVYQYETGVLKYPTTDEIVLPDGGRRQEFQGGVIYVAFQNAVGAALPNGPIRTKYNAVGGLTPGGSLLGYPTQDQAPLPVGQGQMDRFQNGVIYWSPTTGAHPVTGGILEVWASRGYEKSSHGYPTSDQYAYDGRFRQDFQNGPIDWSPNWGINIELGQPGQAPQQRQQQSPNGDVITCTIFPTGPVYTPPTGGQIFDRVGGSGWATCTAPPEIWELEVRLWEDIRGDGSYQEVAFNSTNFPPSNTQNVDTSVLSCEPEGWYHVEVKASGYHGGWDYRTENTDDYTMC